MRCEVIVDGDTIGKTNFVSPPVAGALLETKRGRCRIDSVVHAFGARRMRVECSLVEPAPQPEPKPDPVEVVEETPAVESEPATETTTEEDTEVEGVTPGPHPLRSTHRRRNR